MIYCSLSHNALKPKYLNRRQKRNLVFSALTTISSRGTQTWDILALNIVIMMRQLKWLFPKRKYFFLDINKQAENGQNRRYI